MMDSANSGSMQSSSEGGDDQEFDSSISSFLNPSPHPTSISATPFHAHHQQYPNNTSYHNNPQNPQFNNSDNNNDLIWSRGGLSPNYPNFENLPLPLPIPSSTPQSSFSSAGPSAGGAPTKNPKKRTRASRRPPTTVLTTDTSNFRQMVQEFTGIPSAPFSGSQFSRRMDLFSALRSGDNLGPIYPLRPAAHKILSPFSSSPLLNDVAAVSAPNIGNTNNSCNNNNNSLGASTSNNRDKFQVSDDYLMNLQPSMGFGNLSDFLSRENNTSTVVGEVRNNINDDDMRRWRNEETVGSNQEDLVGFDGSGYNLDVAEKRSMENAASTGAQGTVASWTCPSSH